MSEAGVPTFQDQAQGPQAGIFTPDAPVPPSEPPKPPVDITRLKKMFDDARDGNSVARVDSELSRDYYDTYQLTADERRVLLERGQPPVETNRIKGAVNGILGIVELGKTDPRAYMRNPDSQSPPARPQPQQAAQAPAAGMGQPGTPQPPSMQGQQPQQGVPQPGQQVMGGNGGPPMQDLDAADVATMTLRFIADTTSFKTTKMDVLENILVEGTGAAIFEVDGQSVMASQIRWEEFFADPRSRRHDFKDARYMGVAKWMYADYLSAIYPEEAEGLKGFITDGVISGLGFDMSWEDRPNIALPWFDRAQRRLMVVEMYYVEGQVWNRCVFYAGGILEAGPSPYKDDKGQPTNPIEAQSAYVDRQNRRYGVVRDMRCIQDEINMRRSKALHEINTRQVQQVDIMAPPIDADEVRKEAARPDGMLPPGYQIVQRSDIVANNMTLLAEAKAEIERYAPNPAILGRQGADASGRAQQVRQQAGMTELARVLGRFNDWELRCYKQMWSRARQFYTDPTWVRVTDDTGAAQYVRINDPVHATDPMTGQPQIDPATGQPAVSDVKNNVAKMDIDIIVDSVPDTATLQQEVFSELSQLAQTYGPQNVPFSLVLEMSSLPKKRELIQKLEAFQQQQQQVQGQIAQQKMASEQAQAQAELAETSATAKNKLAQADLYEAQTVTTALKGHLAVNEAQTQLPPGIGGDQPQQQFQPPLGGSLASSAPIQGQA